MDNNSLKVQINKVNVSETDGVMKKCKCCGQELPLEAFDKYGSGYRSVCRTCRREQAGVTEKFKAFTSRELIEELKSRGYRGQLTITTIQTETL